MIAEIQSVLLEAGISQDHMVLATAFDLIFFGLVLRARERKAKQSV